MTAMTELVKELISKISPENELVTLQELNTELTRVENGQKLSEQEGLKLDSIGERNPFPKVTIDGICSSQDDLNQFTCYLFDRRYGWSETDKEDGKRVRRLSSTGFTMSAGSGVQKSILNGLLDQYIKWYMSQELNLPVLNALLYTLQQCANVPVVRHQTVIHFMEWLKENQEQLCDASLHKVIEDLILLSVTDVWSAVRKACCCRLAAISSTWNLTYYENVFNSLIKICNGECSWQAKEGAIMGLNALLQRFLTKPSGKSPMSSPRILDSDNQEKQIPEFISHKIHTVVFNLLSHSQLTIREQAAKTLATYITCSNVMDALSTLHEVLLILGNGKDSLKAKVAQFLDDYAAEGFLGVCIFLVKVIPLCNLLPRWPDYITTFILYLSHPASTVRQAASSVFKYLVVKSSNSVVVLKLMLQSLAMHWNPDTDSMTREISQEFAAEGECLPSVSHTKDGNLANTWEGREGRLFAYELIFKYLIKNHWLYTFGPAGTGNFIDTSNSKEMNSVPVVEKSIAQNSEVDRGMHHVESEKSLATPTSGKGIPTSSTNSALRASDQCGNPLNTLQHGFLQSRLEREKQEVRFLTQAEISDDYLKNHIKGKLDKGPIEGGGVTFRGDVDGICSLLTEAQTVDTCVGDISEKEKSRIKQDLQLTRLKQLVDSDKESKPLSRCSWMEKEHFQDMSRILKVILYQTAESLGHSQWELRRISKQVLPCLAEVIRWYDINLLVSIWNSYLNPAVPTCLMTFTSVMSLKESVVHTVRLTQLLLKPPHTWKDHDRYKDYLSHITNTVQRRISAYLPHLEHLVKRGCYDKLSIVAADVLLMAYEHFMVDNNQRLNHCLSVLELWKKIFSFAHPNTRISMELVKGTPTEAFIAPFEGYLSCCLVKPENHLQCAKQVEKQFISEIYHRLPEFLEHLPLEEVFPVMPLLAHYTGLFVGDSHIAKVMLESLQMLACSIVNYTLDLSDKDKRIVCLKWILLTLKELPAVIAIQSVDLTQVQKVLVVYEELCRPVRLGSHLSVMFSGISARLNETVQFSLETGLDCDEDDLFLMSNEIPRSYSPELQDDSDSEEVVGTPSSALFLESLALNTSNNSGSLTGCLSALSCHSNDGGDVMPQEQMSEGDHEDSSDWDSWDEEDECQSAFSVIFAEFLSKLRKSNNVEFMAELKKLGDQEKAVITGLLKS